MPKFLTFLYLLPPACLVAFLAFFEAKPVHAEAHGLVRNELPGLEACHEPPLLLTPRLATLPSPRIPEPGQLARKPGVEFTSML